MKERINLNNDLIINNYINIESLSLEEKVGQMLMFAFHGTEYNNQLETQIKQIKIGGVIYFARNISTTNKVIKLNQDIQKNAKIPLFIGIDQEGGTVQRIIDGISLFPGAMAVSASLESSYELCNNVAKDLRYLGFNMNFAPVADINNNKYNPVINSRSYSDNKDIVTKYIIESFKGFQDGQIIPTAKHFPGHGDTKTDSHESMPKVNKDKDTLYNLELYPFKKAIESSIDGIMVSHILYPQIDPIFPATLSNQIVTKILKEEMGFKGLIVTDSLTMGAIWQNYSKEEIVMHAVNAGIDILVFCGKADLEEQKEIYNTFVKCVKLGKIPMSRVDESVRKILEYKQKYMIGNRIYDNITLNKDIGKNISIKSITKVRGENDLLGSKNLVIFPKIKVFSLVDNEKNDTITLGKVFTKNNINTDEIIIDENNIDEVINKINDSDYDHIFVATINLKEDSNEVKLWYNLKENIKEKCTIIALRSPYDILFLENVQSYICIYEPTLLAFESLAWCIKNKKFTGILPVSL